MSVSSASSVMIVRFLLQVLLRGLPTRNNRLHDRTSCRTVDHRANSQGARAAAGAAATDVVADLPPGARGCDRWCWFLHDRGLDVAGPRDLLHGVCGRSGLTACPDRRCDAASQRSLHATNRSHVDGRGRRSAAPRVLICDRDRKWSPAVPRLLGDAGIHVVLTPVRAPNANAYAERFVRSIEEECLDRMIPMGERHFQTCSA
jgi:transposase InsO family protein